MLVGGIWRALVEITIAMVLWGASLSLVVAAGVGVDVTRVDGTPLCRAGSKLARHRASSEGYRAGIIDGVDDDRDAEDE